MRNTELLATLAYAVGQRTDQGHGYPADKIEQLWKTLLLNQFHDVLPGTSINEVRVTGKGCYISFSLK